MAQSLLEKLQSKGIKVYSGSPLWESVGQPLGKAKIGPNCVVTKSEKFESFQLVIEEGEKRVYIPLKSGVSHEKEEYTLQEFTATRDWEEYKIVAGETRIFAI